MKSLLIIPQPRTPKQALSEHSTSNPPPTSSASATISAQPNINIQIEEEEEEEEEDESDSDSDSADKRVLIRPCKIMQLDDEIPNISLEPSNHYPQLIVMDATDDLGSSHEHYKRWQQLEDPHMISTTSQIQQPPSSSRSYMHAWEENSHYSQTVSNILLYQTSRSSYTSTSIPTATSSAFSSWSSSTQSHHPGFISSD